MQREPCRVVERQRYSLWHRRFMREALTVLDPPALECAQFPDWVAPRKPDDADATPFVVALPPEWAWCHDSAWAPVVAGAAAAQADGSATAAGSGASGSCSSGGGASVLRLVDPLRIVGAAAPPAPATDDEGWVYSAGFHVGRKNGRVGAGDFVRERTWLRMMQKHV